MSPSVPKPSPKEKKPRKRLQATAPLSRRAAVKKVNAGRMKKRMSEYAKYMASPEWRIKRDACLALAGYKCASCGWTHSEPGWLVDVMDDNYLVAHHLTYKNFRDERQDQLQCLCRDCHNRIEASSPIVPRFKRAG